MKQKLNPPYKIRCPNCKSLENVKTKQVEEFLKQKGAVIGIFHCHACDNQAPISPKDIMGEEKYNTNW